MPYTPVTVTGYNASPPPDDATQVEGNRIKWSVIKAQLGDPLNTAIAAVDDNVAAAIATITSNTSTASSNLSAAQSAYTAATSVLYAPATTAMLFMQTNAPTGWTKGATHNNKTLRLVSGAVTTGGSTAFTSVFTSRTITSSNMPAHTHTWSSSNNSVSFSRTTFVTSVTRDTTGGNGGAGSNVVTTISTNTDTIDGTGAVSGTSSSTGSGTSMDFSIRYVDIIIATKDA